MSDDDDETREETSEQTPMPPGVFVFAVRLPDGRLGVDFRTDDGVDPLSVETILELGAKAARVKLGLPPR